MTKEAFDDYIFKLVPDTYIVRIKMKYSSEKEYVYTNEVLDWCGGYFEWLNDWWEGQQDVQILGCIPLRDVEVPSNFINDKHGKEQI